MYENTTDDVNIILKMVYELADSHVYSSINQFSEEGVLMNCGFTIETNNQVLYMGFTNVV